MNKVKKEIVFPASRTLTGKMITGLEQEIEKSKAAVAETRVLKTLKAALKQEEEEKQLKQQMEELGQKYFLE